MPRNSLSFSRFSFSSRNGMMRLKQNIKKTPKKLNAFKEKERKKSIERIARDDALARVERDDAQEETYVISFISWQTT